MNWSRVKTILILCLLGVNAVLLTLYGANALRACRQEQQDREHLLAALERQGVSVAETVSLPDSRPKGREILLLQDQARERELAETLLGKDTSLDSGLYTGENGALRFRGGGYLELSCRKLEERTAKEVFSAGKEALEAGVIPQTWDGCPVYNSGLTVSEEGDGSVSVTGRWLLGTSVGESSGSVRSAATVLLRYAALYGAAGPTVTALEQGYMASTEAPGYLRLTPVWKITTDQGAVYFSAVSGEEETLG